MQLKELIFISFQKKNGVWLQTGYLTNQLYELRPAFYSFEKDKRNDRKILNSSHYDIYYYLNKITWLFFESWWIKVIIELQRQLVNPFSYSFVRHRHVTTRQLHCILCRWRRNRVLRLLVNYLLHDILFK